MNKWLEIKWSLHPLFIMILLASTLTGYFLELITLFLLVIVHELGHIVMAFAVGWRVKAVKLLPFGGVVEVDEGNGASAKDEWLVAIAGPLQNIWMAAFAWMMGDLGVWSIEWTNYLIQANLWLAAFNMLPILPLDGGKIVLAMLSYRFQFFDVLLWTARMSIVCSVILISYALLPVFQKLEGIKLNELMIGIFLLYSNLTYHRHVPFLFYRFLLFRSKRVEQLEVAGARVVPIFAQSQQSLYEVFKRFKREQLHLLCVVDGGTRGMKLYSEQETLQYSADGSNLHRAVGELFR
ncbi:M50 family metallopeptidase [Paenibacillus endoradicis]|uniref:M50 family metallopeptidase n=1 Tax=Paenibacillus endoradicis TaxID=2972487 RepID=UPI002158F6EA|nr:M50 family metallopeptidase [Paenibacillus endoradicis]MCR8655711.1 M50 family metallopeptidase [Paenibacillus endoradicis]MCR8658037.1 M50 family metallopeptidase [Paenibacillus endoradicis]